MTYSLESNWLLDRLTHCYPLCNLGEGQGIHEGCWSTLVVKTSLVQTLVKQVSLPVGVNKCTAYEINQQKIQIIEIILHTKCTWRSVDETSLIVCKIHFNWLATGDRRLSGGTKIS